MSSDETSERIVSAALKVFLRQGVKRSSLADVAFEAGVTRITVYRYFGDKQGLVQAACRHVAAVFQRAALGKPGDGTLQIDARVTQLVEDLSRFRADNLLARFEEIRRLYPEAYEEFRGTRETALDQIFEQSVAAALREDTLRPDMNLQVAKAMFWASVIGLIENPALIAANIPHAEICQTVTAILRHGMLKGEVAGPVAEPVAAPGDEHAAR